jgi:hypothetical protein
MAALAIMYLLFPWWLWIVLIWLTIAGAAVSFFVKHT